MLGIAPAGSGRTISQRGWQAQETPGKLASLGRSRPTDSIGPSHRRRIEKSVRGALSKRPVALVEIRNRKIAVIFKAHAACRMVSGFPLREPGMNAVWASSTACSRRARVKRSGETSRVQIGQNTHTGLPAANRSSCSQKSDNSRLQPGQRAPIADGLEVIPPECFRNRNHIATPRLSPVRAVDIMYFYSRTGGAYPRVAVYITGPGDPRSVPGPVIDQQDV